MGIESVHESSIAIEEIFPSVFLRKIWSDKGGPAHGAIVDIAPGGKWLEIDSHDQGPEMVYVISGILNDGSNDFPAGSFINNPKGSSHVPQSKVGCKLFVFYPEG